MTKMINKVSSCLVMLAILTSVISGVMSAGVATSSTGTDDSVIITEIMYNPEGTDANHEWIELYNNDTKAINITGWKFYESGTNHTLTLAKGNLTIPIGGYAIIANNATMFLIDHPACNCTVIDSSFSLNNTVGEYIALRNATSDVIDDVTYEPIAADDFTLELNASGGWEESKRVGGTPCQPNSVLPPTSFMVYGYVFYENNTACNYPVVNITNVNTGKNWSAERNASTNYYQLVLSSTVDVMAGDTLRFDAKSPSGNQTKNIEHVITQDEIDNGGLYNSNITLERAALTVTATPTVVYVGENTSVLFNVTSAGAAVDNATVNVSGCGVNESGLTNATGQVTLWVNATIEGTLNVTANRTGYADGTTTLTATAPPLPALTVTATPAVVYVGENTSVVFNVTSAGAAVDNATVNVSGCGVNESGLTNATGQVTLWVNATIEGTLNVTANRTGYVDGTTTLTATMPAPPALTVTATPAVVYVGENTSVVFNVTSAGAGVDNATVNVSGCGVNESGLTNATGQVTLWVNATIEGTLNVTANKTGYADGTTTLTATMPAPPLPALTVTATPAVVYVGENTSVVFNVTSAGTAVDNATVNVSGCGVNESGLTNATGQVTLWVNATIAGTLNVTANRTGYADGTTTLTATAPPLPALTVTATPTVVYVGENTSVLFNVTSAGAAVDNATVNVSGCGVNESGLTNATGQVTLWINATIAGTLNVTANRTGYADGTTTLTATMPAPPVHNIDTGEDFSTIQAAIDAVNTTDGHTITVDAGIYTENVYVYKQLTIRSTSGNPSDTIVQAANASEHVFNVTVDYVNISGFMITGATEYAGIWLDDVEFCNISNNNASNNGLGILLMDSSNNTLMNNNIVSNNWDGIYLAESNNNTLMNNIVSNNWGGIQLQESNNNTLMNITMSNNNESGIGLQDSSNNTLMNNSASNNEIGIYLMNSSNNALMNNIVSNNRWSGIYLIESNNNTLMNNSASNNELGIGLDDSSNNSLTNNDVSNNRDGILLIESSNNNTLTDNEVSDNEIGVTFYDSSHIKLANNTFVNDGLIVYESYENTVQGNTVNSKPLAYLEDAADQTITNAGQVILVNCDNITAKNLNLSNSDAGVKLYGTDNSTIKNINSSNNLVGINMVESNNNTLMNITASNIGSGIYLENSSNNMLTNITASSGLTLWGLPGMKFYSDEDSHNNIVEYLTISSYPTTISFTYDNGIAIASVTIPEPDPAGKKNIGKYVDVYDVSENSWIFLNVSYEDADVANVVENSLRLYHWNWIETEWEVIQGSNVNTEENYVYANITSFSQIAPFGNPTPTPIIRGYAPAEVEVKDTEGATRTFNITVDQAVNVSWQINGTEVQFNESVMEASYTNTSAEIGYWNVTAVATNINGTAIHTWMWNVTPYVPAPPVHNIDTGEDFSTIQAAIDAINTTDGHTITVDAGIYTENVYVYKQLTIRSTSGNPSDTIVQAANASEHVFNVTVDYVNISGFMITGATEHAGICLDDVEFCNISNNNASNNGLGIVLMDSSNNTLMNNNASNNGLGIVLKDSSNNTLMNNIVSNNQGGIYLEESNNNTLMNITMSNNEIGIVLADSSNNTLMNNIVSNNWGGIYLQESSNNTLMNNSASNNEFGIDLQDSSNNTLMNNSASNNEHGIYLMNSSNNTLMNNIVSNNRWCGIYLTESNNNTLMNNSASNNELGIGLLDSSNNSLTNNDVSNNRDGIQLGESSNNTLTDNEVSDNEVGVIFADSSHIKLTNNTFVNDGLIVYESYENTVQGNTVNGKPLAYLEDAADQTITNAGQVILVNCDNITAKNLNLSNSDVGVKLYGTDNSTIKNINSSNNLVGIYMVESNNNTLMNITASNIGSGIYLENSSNNMLTNITASSGLTRWDGLPGMIFYSDDLYKHSNIVESDEDSHNNIVEYLSISSYPTTISFTYDNGIRIASVTDPYSDPVGKRNIGKYVDVYDVSENSWIFLNVSYEDADVANVVENSLRLYHWNRTETEWEVIQGSNVNTEENYVYANVTSFSQIAPFGNPTPTPRPRVGGGGGGGPRDTDGDGITDIEEMLQGTDPKDPCDPNPECAACKALMPAAPAPTTAPVISPTPKPTLKPTPVPTPALATPTPTSKPIPGYEAIFTIASLIAIAVVYVVQRRKK